MTIKLTGDQMGKKRGKYKIFIHTDMQLLGKKKKEEN